MNFSIVVDNLSFLSCLPSNNYHVLLSYIRIIEDNKLSSSIRRSFAMLNLTTPATQRTHTSEASFQSFRNVSACNRCRLRKHRCDQRLPRCEPCEKAGTRCVGYDPLTKREVPRSYVCFLESQVKYLRQILIDHGIEFQHPMHFDEKATSRVDSTRHDVRRRHELSSGRAGIEARVEQKKEPVSLKRKLSSSAENSLPPRQLKRVLQLNLILKDLLTESYASRHCDREHVQPSPQTHISTQTMHGISIPYEPCPIPELSDDHTSSESSSGSPESLEHFDESPSGRDIPAIGDHFQFKGPCRPESHCECDFNSVDLNLSTLETRPLTHENSPTVLVNHPAPSELNGVQASPEIGYDFVSDLAPNRIEQPTYDLLDEFLVGWDEDRLGID